MAARSFSSPQGELEMHRLRRALERVSFDQTLGGRLDESDGEAKPSSGETLSHRSLTDSSKIQNLERKGLSFLFCHSYFLQYFSPSHSVPQMDSCSLPLLWTGTASQTRITSSLQFHRRIPHLVSVARSFTACWVANLCPGRSLWTWSTSGPPRTRKHQYSRDVEEDEEGKEEGEGNSGRRSFTNWLLAQL